MKIKRNRVYCELCYKSWFSRRLVKGKLQTAPRFWKFWGKTAWHQFPISSSRFRKYCLSVNYASLFPARNYQKGDYSVFLLLPGWLFGYFLPPKSDRKYEYYIFIFFGQMISAPACTGVTYFGRERFAVTQIKDLDNTPTTYVSFRFANVCTKKEPDFSGSFH